MIGAKHGLGRLTVVWIIESPVVDAGKGSGRDVRGGGGAVHDGPGR
jgi:hypothetical protein